MPTQSLKFLGKFKDLIPLGFKFDKLFAANYRCYSISLHPNGMSSKIWIWQKGCEVEFECYYGMTADIFHALLDDDKSVESPNPASSNFSLPYKTIAF